MSSSQFRAQYPYVAQSLLSSSTPYTPPYVSSSSSAPTSSAAAALSSVLAERKGYGGGRFTYAAAPMRGGPCNKLAKIQTECEGSPIGASGHGPRWPKECIWKKKPKGAGYTCASAGGTQEQYYWSPEELQAGIEKTAPGSEELKRILAGYREEPIRRTTARGKEYAGFTTREISPERTGEILAKGRRRAEGKTSTYDWYGNEYDTSATYARARGARGNAKLQRAIQHYLNSPTSSTRRRATTSTYNSYDAPMYAWVSPKSRRRGY